MPRGVGVRVPLSAQYFEPSDVFGEEEGLRRSDFGYRVGISASWRNFVLSAGVRVVFSMSLSHLMMRILASR
ncbi:MAG: hypothetical protein IIY05_02765 [Alistipes sp.]|nr:hypothetical protein [Alistipes sp.]